MEVASDISPPPLSPPEVSFLGCRAVAGPAAIEAPCAVIGLPHGIRYPGTDPPAEATAAPAAIRASSQRFARLAPGYDFDLGTSLDELRERLADCGDVVADASDRVGVAASSTAAVRWLVESGAVPIVLGGDDSVPPHALRAYRHHGPVSVLQVDAHLDFRDEVDGVRDGYSSPMRRASEMPWVERIVQVGLRGVGASRATDLEDAVAAGNLLVRADAIHDLGVEWLLEQLPRGKRWFVTIDCDGLDPSVAPGTGAPLPGGLTFTQAVALLRGVGRTGRIVGMAVTEYFPSRDVDGITATVLTRLLVNAIGLRG